MEFYYNDQIRWALGFDNPNKAAALVASILPLLWLGYALSWRIRTSMLRWAAVSLCGVFLLGGWFVLFKTYSRGGAVAAFVAFVYIVVTALVTRSQGKNHTPPFGHPSREGIEKRRRTATHNSTPLERGARRAGCGFLTTRNCLAVAACIIVIGIAAATGVASRATSWIGTREGSVENRVELWKGGLRMIAENPFGVGAGRSGEAYMQWYQPVEARMRYRTLVNSYLTFAAEWGLPITCAAVFLAFAVWWMAGSAGSGNLRAALRASLLAFAVTGFFSTTMEEWKLWLLPGACAAATAIAFLRQPKPRILAGLRHGVLIAGGVTLVLVFFVLAAGSWLGDRSGVHVQIHGASEASITPITSRSKTSLTVVVDPQVLGADYGKLLRELAVRTGANVRAVRGQPDVIDSANLVIATGRQVECLTVPPASAPLILLCPSRLSETAARDLLSNARRIHVMVPEFDEDGRAQFWSDLCAQALPDAAITPIQLSGVGVQIEWVWDEVIVLVERTLNPPTRDKVDLSATPLGQMTLPRAPLP
jgi:O-Antigen ligase